jgi:hypothetical protein
LIRDNRNLPTDYFCLRNLDEGVDKDDIDYKYTACLMKCCPCLAPKEEEEAPPKKTGLKLTVKPADSAYA